MATPPPSPPRFAFQVPEGIALVELDTRVDDDLRLDPAEEALIHPRAVPRRRREFRAGRRAAHLALEAIGRDEGPVLRGPHRQPLWPSGVVGAISHRAGLALAAAAPRSRCAGIGLDVEHVRRFFPALIEQVAFGDERARLEALGDEERSRATLEVFSAKETIYKAFFPAVGRYFGFAAAVVTPGAAAGELEAHLATDIIPGPPRTLAIQCSWFGDLVATALFRPPDG